MKDKNLETIAIHSGYDAKKMLGSLSTPIFQTSTFEFNNAEHGAACFAGDEEGYIYSRLGNPTVKVLEEKVAALEGAERGLAFSSGMGAISAVLIKLTKANDHILCSSSLYGCTFDLFSMFQEKYHMAVDYSDLKSEEAVRASLKPETSVIYVETPINPTMRLVDLGMISKVAKEKGITVVVDNTFSSPYLQRPIDLGCDVVVHSATKYMNGHGDIIAGAVAGPKDLLDDIAVTTQKNVGSIIGPFDAWLLVRGLKTLPLRMDRHCDNADEIVAQLNQHAKVNAVYHPTNDESGVFEKQMKRGGGVISFELKATEKETLAFLNSLSFIKVAVSLGDPESLIEHPASMTHAVIPEAERSNMGITPTLLRLSVGLEAADDIWEDLRQALERL